MSASPRPPRLATTLLRLLVPPGWTGRALAADLDEEFQLRVRRGAWRARAWYWKAVLQVSTAYVWERLRDTRRTEASEAGAYSRASGSTLSAPNGARGLASQLVQDLRFALRSFSRTPGFTLVAAATLALGIASATSVFSVADAVLLRPLPYPAPDHLVHVWITRPERGEWRRVVPGLTALDWTRDAHSFEALAPYRRLDYNVTDGDIPERIRGVSITPVFFQALGIPAALGRLPAPTDADVGAGTVVLSDALWHSRFGGDPDIVGQTMVLDGQVHTVVAVLPAGIEFPARAQLYVPSPYRVPMAPLESTDMSTDRGSGYLQVLGRLADGVTLQAAQAEMDALAEQMGRDFPDTNEGNGAAVVPLMDDLVGNLRPTFALLLGAVGLLMLIVCANVANLLTVRASRRRRELAVRVSIGASLGRVRRQLLTESLVLATLGGIPGLFLAMAGTRVLVRLAPEGIPRLAQISLDPRVFLFALAATLVTGLVFGLAPMIELAERTTAGALRAAGAQGRTRAERLRDGVVVAEVALSVLLVIGAGLMVRTVRALDAVNPGFNPDGVLAMNVALPEAKYGDDTAIASFYEEALGRIRNVPGVESAGLVLTLPVRWAVRGTFGFSIEGRPREPGRRYVAGYQVASSDYFATLRIPVLQGRALEDSDRSDAPLVVVVNEAMARSFWPDENPVGARMTFWGDPDDPTTEWATVVGVVGNTIKEGLDQPPEPEIFMPVAQSPLNTSTFVVRTGGDPYALVPMLRKTVADVDPGLPVYGVESVRDILDTSLAQRRFRMLILGIFAGTALLLAAVGLYGVISFSVAQRTREIGIRMTLGAPRGRVVSEVVTHGVSRVGVGLLLGVLVSLAAGRAVESQLFGVTTSDPTTYVSASLVFVLVAVAACLVPAARAASVDPARSVRVE